MILTRKQEEGVKIAVERYKAHMPGTCIAGYAGSGKSTLVSFIIDALGVDPVNEVCYVAYTGKAALVLKEKGCANAMTAHKLLYNSRMTKHGTFIHRPKPEIDPAFKVIVVDEVSMLPQEMWALLVSHKRYILAMGDPGQLPPVSGGNNVLNSPDIFLDEIMRQAQESEIIRLSMDIRANKRIPLFKGQEVHVLSKREWNTGICGWADQVIVGKNMTCRNTNLAIRRDIYNREDSAPVNGDKVLCRHNAWDFMNEAGDVMVNGSIGILSNIRCHFYRKRPPQMVADFLPEFYNEATAEFSLTDLYFRNAKMDYNLLKDNNPTVTPDNWQTFKKAERPLEFDYGYCITCHKAQGSEYDKVAVYEEVLAGGRETHQKWLYTACTRAKDKLILLKEGF